MGLYDWDRSLNFQVQTRQSADYQEELLGRALRREGMSESLQPIAFSLTGSSLFQNVTECKLNAQTVTELHHLAPLIRGVN